MQSGYRQGMPTTPRPPLKLPLPFYKVPRRIFLFPLLCKLQEESQSGLLHSMPNP